MFKTLRGRFVLSHVLPFVLILPVMGIALVYVLETQVLLTSLGRELTGEALLASEIAYDHTEIWTNSLQAQQYVYRVASYLGTRVMLLDVQGHLLASSDPFDSDRIGQTLVFSDWPALIAGRMVVRTAYSQETHVELVDVLVPVAGQQVRIAGIVRVSQQVTGVSEWFLRLRYLIAGVLIAGLLLGAGAGLVLALNLERPLRQANHAISQIASGELAGPLPERGTKETRELLQSVNSLVNRLQNLEQARRQLLANLVHELGRPLGALHSAIEAIMGGAASQPEVQQELLLGMKGEVHRLERLLDDLSGLYGRVLGSLELTCCPTPMNAWLTGTLSAWREAAQAKNLRWSDDIPPDLPTLDVDPDRLGQALGNLLNNAIKYTPKGGQVSVTAKLQSKTLCIHISDTGPGIASEEQERIFAPLYRSQPGRRFPQGMGLGLTIARDLVAAHGGHLDLESTPGQGSQFTISIPLPEAPAEGQQIEL
jgi:two-component system sensor histidine kinase BaeS